MKIYARQVPPEHQEPPIFFAGCFPEDIAVFGNRDYNEHCPEVFSRAWDALYNGDLLEAWEAINDNGGGYYYSWADALIMLVPPTDTRGPYTREERKCTWPDIAQRYYNARRGSFEEDKALCDALELITGEPWALSEIRGCCQGDWQRVCYPVNAWSRERLAAFETEYFNTGTEWIVHDENTEPETPEDINGFSCYCYGWSDEQIKAEIADAYGSSDAEVILYKFTGWTRSAAYSAE